MENDRRSHSRHAFAHRRPTLPPLYDACLGMEEFHGAAEDDYDSLTEFPCPFCSEAFDVISLCLHIDKKHPWEHTKGACPICQTRIEFDMVDHIEVQHGDYFKKSRVYKGSSDFNSMLRKLCDSSDQTFLEESSCLNFPSNTAPDPLLSRFIGNFPMTDPLEVTPLESSNRETMADKLSDEKAVESAEPSSSFEDEEQVRRTEFLQGLVISTIFDNFF
ncbi:protein DEHYDRATION-INDUCED 19 homolog 2-like [Zingiber officinale]|uniref:protein DEHYDRATION-INDUCED 19 homolog 2-like n=1 Tax=Zingiber officinale TaxID=94328 RepID=UPI001C4D7B94|nr:protein DEHYDRATION-INDUCED 19 homolog 2-like [Zingiber officinale]XP_042421064.1 protein DEHYDRATION-INDUCED 19 homolog 2-like [Zingiber officinale]